MTISDYVPRAVLDLRTEANTDVVFPWFEKSLPVLGDVCEFGCFRGTLSIKLAVYLRALGARYMYRRVYCFDTFEGFTEGAPDGGFPRKGDYAGNDGSYEELRKWAQVVRIWPVKGDARKTCEILDRPLSFVWFDLDGGDVMEVVRGKIWRLITPETIIGVDDYGRPECPTVRPWADKSERLGIWEQIGYDEAAYMAFFRKLA